MLAVRVMKIFTTILDFVLYSFVLGLMGAPLYLMIQYPELGEYFSEFAQTIIPWGIFLILCAVFSDGVRNLFSNLGATLGRVSKLSAGGAAVELNSQGTSNSNLTPEQIDILKNHFQDLTQQKEGLSSLATLFFLKYVGATIYGSQFELLEALEKEPLTPNSAVEYYNRFLTRVPPETNYPFETWAKYLTENFLVQFDQNTGKYVITQAGINFLQKAKEVNMNAGSFPR